MNIFLARQAIYDDNCKAIAYELLHRNSKENKFCYDISEDEATIKLISNSVVIGLTELVNDKIAFINFTNQLIIDEFPSLLPKDRVIIEILESVKPTNEVMLVLHKLKGMGYKFALDDVNYSSSFWEFGDLIDIYKIDFLATTKKEREELISSIKLINPNAKLLAEKVEVKEEYEEAKKNGFSYYQGFFFSKPLMMTGRDMPVRNFTCFNILSELLDKEFDINKVEQIIKSDVAISFKIMKMLNSASFGFIQKISSIKQAIMLIGREALSKWLTIIAMSEMQSSNEEEITKSIIIRARFCELIAEKINSPKSTQCFLAGLFSNLDVYMQKNMDEIISDLPVEEELKEALVGKKNEINKILKLVISYERADNEAISKLCNSIGMDENILVDLYIESINWQNNLEKNL